MSYMVQNNTFPKKYGSKLNAFRQNIFQVSKYGSIGTNSNEIFFQVHTIPNMCPMY